jgi:PAS domain S-box-containing protein
MKRRERNMPASLPAFATQPPAFLRYGVALGAVVLAFVLTVVISPENEPLFALFFVAVLVSAWYGGLGPGLFATLLSFLLTRYYLLPRLELPPFDANTLIRLGVEMVAALIISSITAAHQRTAATLRAEREQLRVTLASIGDAVLSTDSQGRVVFLNGVAESLTGWSLADAVDKDIAEVFQIINAESRQPVESPVARVLREGAITGLANHTLLIARDGAERPIDDSGAPLRDNTGQLWGTVLVFRDITERVQAEAALYASRDQLAVILGGVADGIVALAPDGQMVYANDAAARAIGFPTVQALLDATPGERLQRFALMDEAGQPLSPSELAGRQVLAGMETPSRVVRYRETTTGREAWAMVQARPVRDAQGQIIMSIIIMRDITAQRHAEEERARLLAGEQAARAAAEAAVRLRDQFLSVAAHELRTPLTSLTGQAQLFQRRAVREGHLTARDQQTLRIINEQVTRLNKMVRALLDVSRLELGQLSIERAAVDVGALARRVVGEVRPTADDRTIELRCPDAPLVVQGDELRLEQVLQNLIQNALRYSQPPQPISVTVTPHTDRVCVAVRDQGMGIPAEALPNLFQRFYRADNAAAHHISGMGIGLYVVREIVALHAGKITVESIEGVGSTFTVCFPLDDGSDVDEQAQAADQQDDDRAISRR